MRIVIFCHSIASDWNHGNAHFLRGVATEFQRRGDVVDIFEPVDGWSVTHLVDEQGEAALGAFVRAYPTLRALQYDPDAFDVDEALTGADLVLVHEWNPPALVARIGHYRATHDDVRLFFHDSHHRAVSEAPAIAALDLSHYDGVLAFGDVIRDRYLIEGWARHAWTWHEAADVRVCTPMPGEPREGDVVFVGNWADDEREQELREFFVDPVRDLGLRATVYGVRYPDHIIAELADAGITFRGWLPNPDVPRVFARHAITVHVPRRPYATALPGIPTIRPFEAMACGIPLVSAPWRDTEALFPPGDYLVAEDGAAMTRHMAHLIAHPDEAATMATRARQTILSRHTCTHRVDELMAIYGSTRHLRAEAGA